MDVFLNEIENSEINNEYDRISLITYIAHLPENIQHDNLENASKVLYYAIANTYENREDILLKLFEENEKQDYVILPTVNNVDTCKIYIREKWLFHVILLNSIRHSDVLYLSNKNCAFSLNFLQTVVTHILKCVAIEKPSTVLLLRTLLFILNRRIDVLTSPLSLSVLEHMSKIAMSPISYLKQYAHNISKIVLSVMSDKETDMFLNINVLPIKGVNTLDVVKLFPRTYIKENLARIVEKVLMLFLNNVENKDGGMLYQSILFYSFDEWKAEVWPLLLNGLKCIEYECEFFQSLVKYWIPMTVSVYRSDFYTFLLSEDIDMKIKAWVLLESKKRGFLNDADILCDTLAIFHNVHMAKIGLRILATYHKKSLCPQECICDAILDYLYSDLNTVFEEDDLKSLHMFFSQMFLNGHVRLQKEKGCISFYSKFMERICRFCYGCLGTDRYEVAAQILAITMNIAKGSYRNLKLCYKVEKGDMYEEGDNLLYKELQSMDSWNFEGGHLHRLLRDCFIRNEGNGVHLTKLLSLYAQKNGFVNFNTLKNIIVHENFATLRNTDRIKNNFEILLHSNKNANEILKFLGDIEQILASNLNVTEESYMIDNILYKNVVLLEVILMATKHNLRTSELYTTIEKALDVVDYILEENVTSDRSYKSSKLLEAFINNIMYCLMHNKDFFWPDMKKAKVIKMLIGIIQRSNMKRPVSLAIEVLKQFGSKMEETESDKILRIHFLDTTLKSLYKNPGKLQLKIRRSPESRLVIHAFCSSETAQNKPLLKWVLNFLLDVISNGELSDLTISSAIHTIEILVSDSSMQNAILPVVQQIFIKSVELFSRPSWIVRNADLQLAKALIERFYGVSLNLKNRPKNIEDLFLLFPDLSVYFSKILSMKNLDERSVIVFQFFFESQVREYIFEHEITNICRECFSSIFADIIKKYPNNYGRMAVRAYVSFTIVKDIPTIIVDIIENLKMNFQRMQKNIFANFVFLLQELLDKFVNFSVYNVKKQGILRISFAINDLLKYLRSFDTNLFNLLLFKIKSVDIILKEYESFMMNDFASNFELRLWLHNNLSYLFVNVKPQRISTILYNILTKELPNCMHVKILSILLQRLENSEFDTQVVTNILEILFQRSVLIDDSNNYVLNCYFKTTLIFFEKAGNIDFPLVTTTIIDTENLYKIMIYVLYFAHQENVPSSLERDAFCGLVVIKYINSFGTNEEVDNDILSTLVYFKRTASKRYCVSIFKLVFYGAILKSTHLAAYNFICLATQTNFVSILSALRYFVSRSFLMQHLESDKVVDMFLHDVNKFIDTIPDECDVCDGYYSIESEYLVSKHFLRKILNFYTENI